MNLEQIETMTGGRLGTFDVACPVCGPLRRSPRNQRRAVLRIWRTEPAFASFHCARCGEKGHTFDRVAPRIDRGAIEQARIEAAERERIAAGDRLNKARWLWSKRRPIEGTAAETYLRVARGYGGPLPATLGFLPARDKHGAAMISAFGLPAEVAPGALAISDDAVRGVHITRLAADGAGKAGTETDKIMIGLSGGSPLALAPINDLFGLVIAEGIEDALSGHEATGLGAWAAGAASRLPALADAIPSYVESVSLLVDEDEDGRRHSATLAELLRGRAIETRLIFLSLTRKVAA